jgi:hypothetical protein
MITTVYIGSIPVPDVQVDCVVDPGTAINAPFDAPKSTGNGAAGT